MTFYEAALQILQREGKPLHAREIADKAVQENLLSHVGKQPEVTMASRLASMARRSQDRRLVAVEPDVFGLTDWNVQSSPEALEQSGVVEEPVEELPLLRSRERHPKIDKENVRVAGRGDRRRKYEEMERRRKRKKKRLAPLPEIVWDVLDRAGRPLPPFDLAAAIREHDLVAEDLGREALEAALREENERREAEGRKAVFEFTAEGLVCLLGRPEPTEPADLPALVAQTVAAIAAERKPAAEAAPAGTIDALLAAERSRAVSLLRQRLGELDASALEQVAQAMLAAMGFRDVRIAKRHKEGALLTCRRRMGLVEVRYALKVLRGGRDVRREDVLELRKDLQSHAAQIGVIFSPADPTREARSEAAQSGAALVTLLCADALSEQLVERGLGVRRRTVEVTEFDPASFRALAGGEAGEGAARGKETAAERRERREKERRERQEKRAREREERRKAREAAAAEGAEEAGEAPAETEAGKGEKKAAALEGKDAEKPVAEEEAAAREEEAAPSEAAAEGEAPQEGAAPAEGTKTGRSRRRRRRRSSGAAAAAGAEGEAAEAAGEGEEQGVAGETAGAAEAPAAAAEVSEEAAPAAEAAAEVEKPTEEASAAVEQAASEPDMEATGAEAASEPRPSAEPASDQPADEAPATTAPASSEPAAEEPTEEMPGATAHEPTPAEDAGVAAAPPFPESAPEAALPSPGEEDASTRADAQAKAEESAQEEAEAATPGSDEDELP